MESTKTTTVIEPVRKTVTVAAPVERAFRVFTERIGDWWPVRTHSVHEEQAERVELEPRLGGELYEVWSGGRVPWGTITVWEPPHRLVYTWHPGYSPDEATEVEVRFTAHGEETLVELVHRGWEARGDLARKMRDGYETGWDPVLDRFVERAAAADGV
jgi:uncharacterized protein YndB with AHSA1/START domain